MRIGISANGKNLEDKVSEVFARCPYFIIAEIENGKIKSFEAIENETSGRMGGAGVSAAQLMAEKDVKAVITKNIGPRAFEVLRQFNIEVYQGEGEVKKAIEEFIQGKLEKFE
jgi:predicted Fe-Mo cluster-binding NifX family protein